MLMPLEITFLAGGEPFSGDTPEVRALGGSETACVQMARALAVGGHGVRVFCHCPTPGIYRDVIYDDLAALTTSAPSLRTDVLVVSRSLPLLDLPLQAGLRVLWNHDVCDHPQALAERLPGIDINLVLSRYHSEIFTRALPACGPSLEVTANGLDLDLIAEATAKVEKVAGRLTYVSRPERGLKLLLEDIWPALYARRPNLELRLCGYQVDGEGLDPRLRREYEQIASLVADSPGVIDLGPLNKIDYYRHLASCESLVYPCVFPEISCIAALEAQAVGTPIITTDGFALSETVTQPEFKVGGRPGSQEYSQAFVERTLGILHDPARAADLAASAKYKVNARNSWTGIAAQWEELFEQRLQKVADKQPVELAASLVLTGARSAAAKLLAKDLDAPDEGPAPQDPAEDELLAAMAEEVKQILQSQPGGVAVGVISADKGRTAQALAGHGVAGQVLEIDDIEQGYQPFGVVIIRDRLEREPDPAALLQRAASLCTPGGALLLCVAAGAWPLISPGHLARLHDLGTREFEGLLAGRPMRRRFFPRGLVGRGAQRYFVGRWLVTTPAAGKAFGPIDPTAPWRCHRPAPAAMVQEVTRAGLI